MAPQALPDPSQFDDSASEACGTESSNENSSRRTRQTNHFPSESECLSKLAQLPGLIALGVLTPAKANAMRSSYQEILKFHRENRTREGQGGLTNENVLELAEKNPEILNLLEGFLTPEQIALAMGQSSRVPR